MSDGRAYKAPIVLQRVEQEVGEPYRTLLLVHAYVAHPREVVAALTLDEVEVEPADNSVRLRGKVLGRQGATALVAYLRGERAQVSSPYLFPLPSDPSKPANAVVAKRKLAKITKGQ